jgi:Alpha amylase, catalytic domain
VISKLDYLQRLGVTTVWLSPIFRQRGHLDTYYGYGVQDFLEVDPRFGSLDDRSNLSRKRTTVASGSTGCDLQSHWGKLAVPGRPAQAGVYLRPVPVWGLAWRPRPADQCD